MCPRVKEIIFFLPQLKTEYPPCTGREINLLLHNNRIPCLRLCFKEDFKAVSISIAGNSCERSILVIITWNPKNHVRKHVLTILTTYMEIRLSGRRLVHMMRSVAKNFFRTPFKSAISQKNRITQIAPCEAALTDFTERLVLLFQISEIKNSSNIKKYLTFHMNDWLEFTVGTASAKQSR